MKYRWCRIAASALAASTWGIAAHATEGGGTNWASGVQTAYPAVVPPQGQTWYQDYFLDYDAYKFNDASGHSYVPGFHLNAVANASRIFHTWTGSLLHAEISSAIIVAGNNIDLRSGGHSGNAIGIDYVYLAPLYLTWNTKTFHLSVGEGAFVPTGQFSKNDLISASSNYVTFNQEVAMTWFPTERLDFSAEAELQINFKNTTDGYQSGNVINIDLGADYQLFPSLPKFRLGPSGFITSQFSNDTINGIKVGDGNRLQKFGIGPQFVYLFDPKTAIALKWQHEVAVSNGPRGERFWLQFQVPL